MARTPKTTLDFISLDCKDGLTLKRLHRKYGKEGRYFWIELLRIIGRTSNYYLDFSDPVLAEDLLEGELFVESDFGENVLNDLAQWGNIDAKLWNESRLVWCQSLIDRHDDTWRKRQLTPVQPNKRRGKAIKGAEIPPHPPIDDISGAEIPQSKEEESKEEESKAQKARADFELLESSIEEARSIAEFFSVAEVNQHQKFSLIVEFCKHLIKNNQIEHFLIQFDYYKRYKAAQDEKLHGLSNYIGQPPNYAGAWNECDWKDKFSKRKPFNGRKTPSLSKPSFSKNK